MPWYATQQIRQGTALAYDVGHRVPDTNVETHGYDTDGLVVWAEPGNDIPAAADATPLMGAFPNAPQPLARPEPDLPAGPVEEAADGTTRRTRRAAADPTTSTDTEA